MSILHKIEIRVLFNTRKFEFSFIYLHISATAKLYHIVYCFLLLHSFSSFLICFTKQVSRFTLCRNLLILNNIDKHDSVEVLPSMGH